MWWREQQNSCPHKGIDSVLYMGRRTPKTMPSKRNPHCPIRGGGNNGINAPQKESTLSYTTEGEERNSWPSKRIYLVLTVGKGTSESMLLQKNTLCPIRGKGNGGIHALQKESTLSYTWGREQRKSCLSKRINYVLNRGERTMEFMLL